MAKDKRIKGCSNENCEMHIDKKKMSLDNPIKELGTANVTIKLHPKVTASLKVVVKEA